MMLASISAMANRTPGGRPTYVLEPCGDAAGVGEIAELRRAGEGRGGERHHRDGADDHDDDADPEVDPLIAHEARRDALVDDVALLEEQLPRRDRRADDGDDQQHHVGELRAGGQLRHDEIVRDLADAADGSSGRSEPAAGCRHTSTIANRSKRRKSPVLAAAMIDDRRRQRDAQILRQRRDSRAPG